MMAEDSHSNDAAGGIAQKDVRSNSMSNVSENSQTAQEYIQSQLQLEADAREAMPYQFDTCTRPFGPLRQVLYSCLTCNPPPANTNDTYTPAGVCYSCSISCHGEHELVELFSKRNFVCDCGTTRLPDSAPCTLRINATTGTKGGVTGEPPVATNKYNHNYRNRFCACEDEYNPHIEKGTMFQCMGLGSVANGGCLEDWWHPECIMGWERKWYEKEKQNGQADVPKTEAPAPVKTENTSNGAANGTTDQPHDEEADEGKDDPPVPPGFPDEEDFDLFICYKCVEANPWIKRYANAPGFLPPVYIKTPSDATLHGPSSKHEATPGDESSVSRKRKAEDDDATAPDVKRQREFNEETPSAPLSLSETCKYKSLPAAPTGKFSLFFGDDFRDYMCRCQDCFPLLKPFPQLLEEEDTYEPPRSEDGEGEGAQSVGTGSLLDRGEAALSNMDRVRAIEGVMVYNHLRDKVKSFLQPFAESGQAVGAEDIKAYFEKLRGDAEGMKQAASGAQQQGGDGEDGDNRKEQSGY